MKKIKRKKEKNKKKLVIQGSHKVSGTHCPYVSKCGCMMVRGAAAPKGPMTYADFI